MKRNCAGKNKSLFTERANVFKVAIVDAVLIKFAVGRRSLQASDEKEGERERESILTS